MASWERERERSWGGVWWVVVVGASPWVWDRTVNSIGRHKVTKGSVFALQCKCCHATALPARRHTLLLLHAGFNNSFVQLVSFEKPGSCFHKTTPHHVSHVQHDLFTIIIFFKIVSIHKATSEKCQNKEAMFCDHDLSLVDWKSHTHLLHGH